MGSLTDPGLSRQFRALFGSGTASGMTDGQLLERFLIGEGEDAEVAFSALLARHGPMVLGVCRRALRDPVEAEDAFQATFLVLVRRGGSVRVDDSLGRWLYGVSRRVAGRARARADRRRRVEGAAIGDRPAPASPPDCRELAGALDEELGRLAEPFRSTVVLCDLVGLSHEEAARDLRCPVGTVKSRLARGRERLRGRLARRGFAPSALIPSLQAVSPAPPALIDATIGAATRFAASGGVVPAGAVSASALALAEGILRTMTMNKIQSLAAASLMIALAGSTAAVVAQQRGGENRPASAFNRTKVQQLPRRDAEEPKVTLPKLDPPEQEARLDAKVTLDLANRNLRDIKDTLEAASGLRIIIDPKAMAYQKLGWWAPQMDLRARDEPLRSVLTRWLEPLGLDWEGVWGGSEGIVYVTTNARMAPRGLVAPDAPAARSQVVDPFAKVEAVTPPDQRGGRVEAADPKLDKPVTVKLRDRPIDEVNRALMKQTGLSIELDPLALHNLGMSRDTPVGLAVEDVPLRAALTTWLGRTGLGWRYEDGFVLVTTAPREVGAISDRPGRAQATAGPAGQAGASGRPEGADLPHELSKVLMPEYIVEPPDIITVDALEALPGRPITGQHLVRPDGRVSLGFYGEVFVAGLTLDEVKEKVIDHLRGYLPDDKLGLNRVDEKSGLLTRVAPKRSASVFVDVVAYNSKVYYVQGDVGTPGRLPITGNETVLDAINYAGGLIPTSLKGADIRVVRPAKDGKPERVLTVDFPAIQLRGESATNYQLFPGDRVVVTPKEPRVPAANPPPDRPEAGDVEARIGEMERKLDLILKRLDGAGKP